MKKLFTATILLCSLISTAQKITKNPNDKSRGYAIVYGGAFKFDKQDYIPNGAFSAGVTVENFSIGMGAVYSKFKNDKNAYIPVFAELTVIGNARFVPFMQARGGVAIYNNTFKVGNISTTTKGGFYFEARGGLAIGDKSGRMLIGAGYVQQSFRTEVGNTVKNKTDIGGLSLFIGIKL